MGFTAVATPEGLELGGYYLGLTRDDMGGLQFLYKKNNYAFQSLDSNTVASPFVSSWEAVNTTNSITGISNFSGLLGGAEKITFVKVAYDSLLGTNFAPIIYNYTMPYVTNYQLSKLQVTRTVTAPDILFTAADLINSEALFNYLTLVVLDNVGPVFFNINPGFLVAPVGSYLEYPIFNWGSFDGSTNPPILYPNGSSLAELEQQVLSGEGLSVPVYPWAPVLNPSATNTTGAGGGGGGAGAGGN